jgi:hypothetical protein
MNIQPIISSLNKQPWPFVIFCLLLFSCSAKEESFSPTRQQRAVKERPVIMELVVADTAGAAQKFTKLIKEQNLQPDALYQWKDHFVLFDVIKDTASVRKQLVNAFPKAIVKQYDSVAYAFDRTHCDSAGVAAQWDQVLLTANLVVDTEKQNEYLQYHATQFEKWPEVAKGFCHAQFQQLLVYKKERQLMLVISIPHGENVDQLNPKTTENNPRVDEWNRLMQQYQEGIPGTVPGEVWVFLQPVSFK